jgi:hypothetical protein
MEIHRIAGVGALQKREPGGVPGRGCSPIASEAYRVPGPVFVMPAPEGKKISVCHGDGSFQTPESVDVNDSLRAANGLN